MRKKDAVIALLFPGQGPQRVGMGADLYKEYKVVRDVFFEANLALGYGLEGLEKICFQERFVKKYVTKEPAKIREKLMNLRDLVRGRFDAARENWHEHLSRIKGLTDEIQGHFVEEPTPQLNLTIYTQPAVATVNFAYFRALQDEVNFDKLQEKIKFYAGHSLGELVAMTAAGVFSFKDGIQLVRKRAEIMGELEDEDFKTRSLYLSHKAQPIPLEIIKDVCTENQLYVSIQSTDSDYVIGGPSGKIEKAKKEFEEQGLRAMVLPISGAFHTPIYTSAGEKLKRLLMEYETESKIHEPTTPVMANTSAESMSKKEHVVEELYRQTHQLVRWKDSMQKMLNEGVNTFVEVGIGSVLSSYAKKMFPDEVNVISLFDPKRALHDTARPLRKLF
jgi:[acyl-carrier-protein] S-malonyltransferase